MPGGTHAPPLALCIKDPLDTSLVRCVSWEAINRGGLAVIESKSYTISL